jgi:hypothetical protein
MIVFRYGDLTNLVKAGRSHAALHRGEQAHRDDFTTVVNQREQAIKKGTAHFELCPFENLA